MVNGVRTDMVNERLIWRPARPGKAAWLKGTTAGLSPWDLSPWDLSPWDLSPWNLSPWDLSPQDINLQTQPLSSRMASCQIISMPASLSFRQGMAAKF
jgi:hypothetical protein